MPKRLFIAYPFRFDEDGYREVLEARLRPDIEPVFADDVIENKHVLQKIRDMMQRADACMFDITDNNHNVWLELGIAIGENQPGFVAVNKSKVGAIGADIVGWDQLRYSSFEDLADKVYDLMMRGALPARPPASVPDVDVKKTLRTLKFGAPESEDARLIVFALPVPYERHYKDFKTLHVPEFSAKGLVPIVNAFGDRGGFWAMGSSWSPYPRADHIEAWDGGLNEPPAHRDSNLRLYLSGLVVYARRIQMHSKLRRPFVYLYSLRELVEAALGAIAETRLQFGFGDQKYVAVGAALLNAPNMRFSSATREFYPANDQGFTMDNSAEVIFLPDEPLVIESAQLQSDAAAIAKLIESDVRAQLLDPEGELDEA